MNHSARTWHNLAPWLAVGWFAIVIGPLLWTLLGLLQSGLIQLPANEVRNFGAGLSQGKQYAASASDAAASAPKTLISSAEVGASGPGGTTSHPSGIAAAGYTTEISYWPRVCALALQLAAVVSVIGLSFKVFASLLSLDS